MREPVTATRLPSEAALAALAGSIARAWQAAGVRRLVIGLRGELGAGKTSFVRALLRGLGHGGRVPSPTYTLLEQYDVGHLAVVHLDLYRLGSDEELEHIGIRDWLGRDDAWILAEWPERAPSFAAHCDLLIDFAITGELERGLDWCAKTARGRHALGAARNELFSYQV